MKANITIAIVLLAAAILVACGEPPKPAEQPVASKPTAPAVPPEIEAVAQSVLGSEAEPLVWGDLALTGAPQVLAINRLKPLPGDQVPGIKFTRLALVSKEGGKWKELLRCDDHLKNPKGYLGGTPLSSVSGWRLQYEQLPEQGLALYFTPLEQPAGGYIQTIGVRWNPKAKRYQSLERTFQQFLGEVPSLGTVESQLKR
jgi:hypothetical protein